MSARSICKEAIIELIGWEFDRASRGPLHVPHMWSCVFNTDVVLARWS